MTDFSEMHDGWVAGIQHDTSPNQDDRPYSRRNGCADRRSCHQSAACQFGSDDIARLFTNAALIQRRTRTSPRSAISGFPPTS